MTSTALARPKGAKGLVLSGDPIVQLLPPAVRDRTKNREFRRIMVLLIVLSVALVAAGVAFGLFRTIQAQVALDAANAETARLLAEQEIYRADAAVADVVENTHAAQSLVSTTEVDWRALYQEIDDRIGSRGNIMNVSFRSDLPWQPASLSPGPFHAVPSVSVAVTVQSPSVLTLAEISDRLATIPGLLEVSFASTSRAGVDGDFVTVVDLTFDEQLYIGRYTPAEEEAPAATPTDESTEEATQ